MPDYLEIIKKCEETQDHWKSRIILCFKDYILANHETRMHPLAYSSVHHPEQPQYAEYLKLSTKRSEAYSKLWMVTDMEYDKDGFREFMWEWRYWKVMARKCCWSQLSTGKTDWAGQTMRNLHEAEFKFVEACGLEELYRSPCSYLEEAFPNLKKG